MHHIGAYIYIYMYNLAKASAYDIINIVIFSLGLCMKSEKIKYLALDNV